jgi:hypothetical protein
MGQFTATSTALSRLTTINENQTVTGYEQNSQRANNIGSGSHRSFVSSAANVLNTVASVSYTINYFTEESHYTGVDYFFRDLNNSGGGIGTKYDFAVNQDYTPLYYGTAPDLSGDTTFKPYALSDANLVAGLSNGVLKLWEPGAGAFRAITVPNPITEDSIRITNCCGSGGAIRITDPPASDPNAEIFILAGDNLILRTAKDVDGNPLPSPTYTVFAAKKLLPKDSPYTNLALKNISNNGTIAATASKRGDSLTHAILFSPVELWALKKPGTEDNDVLVFPLPLRKAGESDNAYIQRDLSDKHIAFIQPHSETNDSPGMPNLVARLPGASAGLKVRWRLEVEYKRGNGYRAAYVEDFTRPEDTVRIPFSQGSDPVFTAEMDAAQEWRIFESEYWTNEMQQRGFFGGTGKLFVWVPATNPQAPTEPVLTFRIGGRNPDQEKARAFIDGSAGAPFWYAYAIAKHETFGRVKENGTRRFYNQFYTKYQGGPIGDDARDMGWVAWAKSWPLYNLDRGSRTGPQNGPGGYGLFQMTLGPKHPNDPVVGEDFLARTSIWNWQDNTRSAVAELRGKALLAQTLVQGLEATYPSSGRIPNYGHFSGLEATVITFYNGMSGPDITKIRVNGFTEKQKNLLVAGS